MIIERTRIQVLEEIERYGNIYAACLRIGINRSTFYRWIEKSKKFKKDVERALMIGRGNICDMAESGLLQNIKSGNQRAVEYALSHNSERYKKTESNVVIVHKKDFTPVVRDPTFEEILAVYEKITTEHEQEMTAVEEREEAERLEREKQQLEREEKWKKEHENIERIPPNYELKQQETLTQQSVIETQQPEKIKNEIRKGPRPRDKEERNHPPL